MNFYELYKRIEDETQELNKRTVIKDFINRVLLKMCETLPRRLLIKLDDFTLSAGVEDYNLPADCNEIIGFYKEDILGQSQEPQDYFNRIYLDQNVDNDKFLKFMVMSFGNPDLIECNEINGCYISSSGADDMTATIIGADSLLARFSTVVTLNHSTSVSIMPSAGVTKIKEITVNGITVGTLSIYQVSDSSLLAEISAGVTYRDWGLYRRKIKITEVPANTTTIKIAYFQQPKRLVHDFEYPVLPDGTHDIIIAGALVKYYKYVSNVQLSHFWRDEYDFGMAEILDKETRLHSDRNLQMSMAR